MKSWELEVILEVSPDPKDHWTVDDAMKGTSIIGGTGSGKTTGSGKAIAMKFLQQGWGGLVLCAKTEEAGLWEHYCKKAGRTNDLIIFGKNAVHKDNKNDRCGKPIVFNPLHYESTRSGEGAGDVFNITNIFMNLHKIANRASGDGEARKDDRFWDNALKRIISRTIELLKLAGEELTFKNIVELIYTAPTERNPFDKGLFATFRQYVKYEDEPKNKEVLSTNFFLKCLAKSFNKTWNKDENHPDSQANLSIERYFTKSLPYMSEHTHNAIIESFMGVAEPFQSGILNQHFSGETTLIPEEIFTENKIIILDFPVKEFLDAGIMAQGVFKLLFQQAVERRDTTVHPTPCFLWADEAQYFVNPYDQLFLTTARSSRTATVYLSQNISNYYAVMGGGHEARPKVDSLMGNLSTKIFHANSDAETNEYASRLIGQSLGFLPSQGSSTSIANFGSQSSGLGGQYLPQIQPREFTMLRSGGANNNFEVDAVIFATGKIWSTDTNFYRQHFNQSFTSSLS